MHETAITIEDAARCLPELVDRVCASGEAALLTKFGMPRARIVPVTNPIKAADELSGFLRRWRHEHPEPDEQFAQALEESRKSIRPPRDPWESS